MLRVRSAAPLTPAQEAALLYVGAVARARSHAVLEAGSLLARVAALDAAPAALWATLRWVRDRAPLVVHVSGPVLRLVLASGEYKNRFEVFGHCGQRERVEDALFNSAYAGAAPADRVRYGSLNFVNDPAGVASAISYGAHHLVLSDAARVRATFANADTFGTTSLATCETYAHVLAQYNDAELAAALAVGASLGGGAASPPVASSAVIGQYKEFQLHGKMDLARDVAALHLHASDPLDGAFVAAWRARWPAHRVLRVGGAAGGAAPA